MKPFHIIKAFAVAALVAVAPIASNAQTYSAQTITPISGAITAGSTSNTTAVLDVRRNKDYVSFSVTGTASAANPGSTLTFTFLPSVDGVNFASNPTLSFVWALGSDTSQAAKTVSTNLLVQGYGYLKLSSIVASSNTNSITLNSVTYGVKNPSD